ncbi:aldose epimerase family protein [Sediminibacterium soli]|uniref:aldose epimerase family protein n=1 Tax=Sediminibacterium soli TaxID=2698829 RepID=UPI0013798668|nr:aldose epimerase family protein [Sediminibacterium soli]NCI45730.1 galactose mutarotase [Sediminibacterium soli]
MKRFFVFLSVPVVLAAACNDAPSGDIYRDTAKQYGVIGRDTVRQYTLYNANGMQVKILNYGGTITNLFVPDRTGNLGDVVLGYDSLAGYLQKGNPYFGCLVGRYANRIAQGTFTLEGKTYTLARNNGNNALHGGLKGFDKVIWQADQYTDSTLQLAYVSKDGEEGYPGAVTVVVLYTVTADNALKISYSATTDKATPVNLTNHAYFNLSAGKDSTVLHHMIMINADKFTEVNDQLIPTGKLPDVKGTPMDFTNTKKIGRDIASVKGGYDHNWVLNPSVEGWKQAAVLYDSASGRMMEVRTTQPGIQFYTGNFLDGSLRDRTGKKIVKHAGLCLETQHFPDGPNQPAFPNTILRPGETYQQATLYKFSVK